MVPLRTRYRDVTRVAGFICSNKAGGRAGNFPGDHLQPPGKRGVGVRFSDDEGASWSEPRIIVRCEGASDGGYPSSSQIADGTVVTAYYTNRIDAHARYHMGVVRWQPAERMDP